MSDPALVWLTVCAALVLALVPGYAIWLRRIARATPARGGRAPAQGRPDARGTDRGEAPAGSPSIEIVVPVRDEALWIEDKLRDLAALEAPPGGLTFWIVDGASPDGTAEIVARWAACDPRFRLLRTSVGDKTAQLNAVLPLLHAPWVMVTDADARLARDTVTAMLRAGADDPLLAVVGVPVDPADHAHPLERLHWRLLNRLRRDEGRGGCAAIVTGPCYVFRRDVLRDGFPSDVVADDVHVAFAAAAMGRRVGFVDRTAVELRTPRSLSGLFRHKIRKADAYLREVVRFLPGSPRLPSPAREVFLWRAAQMILFPFVVAVGAAAAGIWVSRAEPSHVAWAAAAFAAPLVADAAQAALRRRPPVLVHGAALGALLAVVLAAVVAGLPFSRRTAALPKIADALPAPGASA